MPPSSYHIQQVSGLEGKCRVLTIKDLPFQILLKNFSLVQMRNYPACESKTVLWHQGFMNFMRGLLQLR